MVRPARVDPGRSPRRDQWRHGEQRRRLEEARARADGSVKFAAARREASRAKRRAASASSISPCARAPHTRAARGLTMDADDPLERLHDACASGDLAAARAASDADLNAVDAEGRSALHHACAGGHLDVVLHVLDRAAPGACNLRDANDMAPSTSRARAGTSTCSTSRRAPGPRPQPSRHASHQLFPRIDVPSTPRCVASWNSSSAKTDRRRLTTATRVTMCTVDSDRGGKLRRPRGSRRRGRVGACGARDGENLAAADLCSATLSPDARRSTPYDHFLRRT